MAKTVGLIDVDSHNYPNLALMKIAAWHKEKGDHVEWWLGLKEYDVVYKSKIFDDTYTKDDAHIIRAKSIIKGGTGYDLKNKLPSHIEHIYPDYSIYEELTKDTAFGFLTRGCPRRCGFCIVSEKEGCQSYKVADLNEFFKSQKKIELLDPNILACKDRMGLLEQLAESNAKVNFSQGLDIRFMSHEIAHLINNIKIDAIHFAWDNYENTTYKLLKKYRASFEINRRNLRVYVLTNYNTSHEQDLDRIYKLKELEYEPYVMIYDKPHAPSITKALQRWCNSKWIFRTCEAFEDYKR